jgi:Protein of unknown function (DUF1822)
MTYVTDEFALPLPITQAAQQTADQFAQQFPGSKAEQIRLNTLAVLVVQDYLKLMEIPTNLSVSDSWNPVLRACADIADLEVSGIGRLECRPVLPSATTCPIPPETWNERVGYVVVQIDEADHEAKLLGFVPTTTEEELSLSQLRSPEDLLDHLYNLKSAVSENKLAIAAAVGTAAISTVGQTLTRLGAWLTGEIEQGWQQIDELLNPAQVRAVFRRKTSNTVLRAKSLDLSPALESPVALVVQVKPQAGNQAEVTIALFSTTEQSLPANLRITAVDSAGTVLETSTARESLTLDSCSLGDRFSIQVSLNDTTVDRDFVV